MVNPIIVISILVVVAVGGFVAYRAYKRSHDVPTPLSPFIPTNPAQQAANPAQQAANPAQQAANPNACPAQSGQIWGGVSSVGQIIFVSCNMTDSKGRQYDLINLNVNAYPGYNTNMPSGPWRRYVGMGWASSYNYSFSDIPMVQRQYFSDGNAIGWQAPTMAMHENNTLGNSLFQLSSTYGFSNSTAPSYTLQMTPQQNANAWCLDGSAYCNQ